MYEKSTKVIGQHKKYALGLSRFRAIHGKVVVSTHTKCAIGACSANAKAMPWLCLLCEQTVKERI